MSLLSYYFLFLDFIYCNMRENISPMQRARLLLPTIARNTPHCSARAGANATRLKG